MIYLIWFQIIIKENVSNKVLCKKNLDYEYNKLSITLYFCNYIEQKIK